MEKWMLSTRDWTKEDFQKYYSIKRIIKLFRKKPLLYKSRLYKFDKQKGRWKLIRTTNRWNK